MLFLSANQIKSPSGVSKVMYPVTTTTKSMMFHTFLDRGSWATIAWSSPEVRSRVEDKPQRDDLEGELDGEDDEEVVLGGLQLHGQQGLVVVRQVLLHGHHDAGGDDRDQNRPLEGRAEVLRNIGHCIVLK